MKLPRNLDAPALIRSLQRNGYRTVRQTGSHIRLHSDEPEPHTITIPNHSPLKLGTLAAILGDIAQRRGMTRGELLSALGLSD